MASCLFNEYYQVGQVLTLSVVPEHGEIRSASTVHAKIRQFQTPRTLSCCMIVDLVGEGCPSDPVFLKLYDRRFSDQLRCDHGIDLWTRSAEEEYINTVQTGAARQFLHNLHTIPNYEEDTEETWDDGQIEAFLTDQVCKLSDAETSVYKTLHDIQGKLVPRLIAGVQLALPAPSASTGHTDDGVSLTVKGVLLQYIESFSLSKIQHHAPKSEWQGIVDQAVAIVQVVGDHGVLNRDVRPDSFLVQGDRNGGYGVFMIDFGLARLRGKNESERDWAKANSGMRRERLGW